MDEVIRVLVVDDTVVYRKIVQDLLAEMNGVEVLGAAPNGKVALQRIEQLSPDLITLDLEMPEMGGLEVLERLQASPCRPAAIMLSAFTSAGAEATVSALSLGAFDFVTKPVGEDPAQNKVELKRQLQQKFDAFRRAREIRGIIQSPGGTGTVPPMAPSVRTGRPAAPRPSTHTFGDARPELVVIGVSTGGPSALTQLLPAFPADFPLPILVVQHMPPMFTKSLADDLTSKCALNVNEGRQYEPVVPGMIRIAPGGSHMKVIRSDGELALRITHDPPENSCRPSVDFLFRSVAHTCEGPVIAAILTGMGNDGALGCSLLKRKGAFVIAQDEASCVVYGMPKEVVDLGLADEVLPLNQIAARIMRAADTRVLSCR